jgi:DNA-binding transcriptional LysR family regulator
MEMQQIRYFLALARTLNFTRAAEECNVSQPALTRAVQGLEAEFGGELIRRERQNSHLTELGKRMLPLMQQCYDSALAAKSLAKSVKGGALAPLNFAVSNSVDLELLTPPLAEMFRAFPGIQLKIVRGGADDIVRTMKEGEADLAVAGPLGQAWDRFDSWPMFVEPFELAAPRDDELSRRNDVEPEMLAGKPIVLQSGSESHDELTGFLHSKGISESSAHRLPTHHDVLALVEAGLGFALVPTSAPRYDGVARMPLKGLDLKRTISIYGVAGRQRSAPAVTLLNLLRAQDWRQAVSQRL